MRGPQEQVTHLAICLKGRRSSFAKTFSRNWSIARQNTLTERVPTVCLNLPPLAPGLFNMAHGFVWNQTSGIDVSSVVNYLATLPQYHRRGLGRLLINVCLKDADEAHANTFLIATPAGSGLYRKLGFKEIDRVSWDTLPYGGDGVVTWLCMTRLPNASEVNASDRDMKMQTSTLKQVEPEIFELHD